MAVEHTAASSFEMAAQQQGSESITTNSTVETGETATPNANLLGLVVLIGHERDEEEHHRVLLEVGDDRVDVDHRARPLLQQPPPCYCPPSRAARAA